jgi:ubiquitin carboxyl-terminal hydrolase 36/42
MRTEAELKMESGGNIENGSKDDSTLKRRIKFQLATKQYIGFKNNTSDFKIETLNPGYNSRKRPFAFEHHHPGQSVKKVDGSDFVENGLDPELCFGISFRKIVSFYILFLLKLNFSLVLGFNLDGFSCFFRRLSLTSVFTARQDFFFKLRM